MDGFGRFAPTLILIGCATTADVPATSDVKETTGPLLVPHADQVCQERGGEPATAPLHRMIDRERLFGPTDAGDGIRQTDGDQAYHVVVEWPHAGAPRVLGALHADGPEADAWVARVQSAVRPLPPLLEPVRERFRVDPVARSVTRLAPLTCLLHVAHGPDGTRLELPGGVRVVAGSGSTHGFPHVRVRVGVDAAGDVRSVEVLSGDAGRVEAVRALLVDHVRFHPASRNGVPVEGSTIQTFVFPSEIPGLTR